MSLGSCVLPHDTNALWPLLRGAKSGSDGSVAVAVAGLYWLAGMLDGEGCFHMARETRRKDYKTGRLYNQPKVYRYPRIVVKMVDEDTIQRIAAFFNVSVASQHNGERWYPSCVLTGRRAIGWMMTLYPLMSQRRQAKIREIIGEWRESD